MKKIIFLFSFIISFSSFSQKMAEGFVYLSDVEATIKSELRYFSKNNFIGTPIDGYKNNCVVITKEAANALKKVQEILARLDNTDNFGVYRLDSLTVDSSNANLYDAAFTHIVSNGNITANKYYGFAIYPEISADKNFTFVQSTAATTWNITHNLGKFPSVSIVDSGNTIVRGNIDYTSENALTITFSAAFGGKAYLN